MPLRSCGLCSTTARAAAQIIAAPGGDGRAVCASYPIAHMLANTYIAGKSKGWGIVEYETAEEVCGERACDGSLCRQYSWRCLIDGDRNGE